MSEKSKQWVAVLRTLHHSRKLNKVSEGAELLYRRLLEVVDDNGNYDADPALILGQALARRMAQGLTAQTTADRLKELVKEELVWLYRGGELLHISNHYTRLRADGHGAIVLYDPPTPDELALPRTPNGDQEVTKRVPQRRVEESRVEKRRESPQPSADGLALSRLLLEQYRKANPNCSNAKAQGKALETLLARWAAEFDVALRNDGKTRVEFEGLILWAFKTDFWPSKIGSPAKLRVRKGSEDRPVWVQYEQAKGIDPKAVEMTRRAKACLRNTPDCRGSDEEEVCTYCTKTVKGSKR